MAMRCGHVLPLHLGWLVRSWGEDATLGNVLQMLDEHYDIVMTFDALSKELYSLKQGMGENLAEFRVCLFQQVQIHQTGVSQQNSRGACGEGEMGPLLQGP